MCYTIETIDRPRQRKLPKPQIEEEVMKRAALILALVVSFGLAFNGCMSVGLLTGINTGSVSDTVSVKMPSRDILALGIEVAQSMDFRLISRDMTQKMAYLEYGDTGRWSNPLPLLIGKIDNNTITLTVSDARSLFVQVNTTGTFGSGDYKDAVKILDEFKKRIAARIQ